MLQLALTKRFASAYQKYLGLRTLSHIVDTLKTNLKLHLTKPSMSRLVPSSVTSM